MHVIGQNGDVAVVEKKPGVGGIAVGHFIQRTEGDGRVGVLESQVPGESVSEFVGRWDILEGEDDGEGGDVGVGFVGEGEDEVDFDGGGVREGLGVLEEYD